MAGQSPHRVLDATGFPTMFAGMTRRKAGRTLLVVLLLALTAGGAWMAARPMVADYHARQAAQALTRQRYSQALAAYQRAILYSPDSPRLHLLAGRTARQAGDLDMARMHVRLCRELQGGVTEEQQLEEYMLRAQSGEVDEVYPYLHPYQVQEGPLTALVLESLARAYMAKYRIDLAWECLRQWGELEPDNVEAMFRRGVWFVQQQNAKAAGEEFRRALELDPDRINVRLTYAEVLRLDKQFDAVAAQYREVLRVAPGQPDAVLGLARYHVEQGQPTEAGALLETLPTEKQDEADFLWIRGMVEFRTDHPEAAEPLFRQALARDPRHTDACYNLMLCLNRLQKRSEAEEVQSRFRQMEADQKRLVELTTQELHAHPNDVNLRCELGELYLRMGVPERGLHWLHAALQLDPASRRAHEQLRDYYSGQPGAEAAARADAHRRQLAAGR